MKLIIESGATRSTWVVTDDGKVVDKQVLAGINPTSNPSSVKSVHNYEVPRDMELESIHFYGAGVSSAVAKDLLRKHMESHFGAQEIWLEHDILAAARSISHNEESIVSILGTGTNTVVFDGKDIIQSFKALGYMFGDYGSGFHIGKCLIRAYFTGNMSADDEGQFAEKYINGEADFLFRIYESDRPNFETARLSKFLNICSNELKHSILNQTFQSFFVNQILPIKNHMGYKLNFVGSIAAHFENELKVVAKQHNVTIGKVVSNPIDGLIYYHNNN